MSEAVLELDQVVVQARFGGHSVAVLRNISLAVAPGRVLGIVGESGAGKSMIGRLIAGMIPPGFTLASGAVRFRGTPLPESRRALLGRDIAFVAQEPLSALDPVFTIGQQFGEHLARLGVPRGERSARAAASLAEVRIPRPAEVLRRYPHELSGGQCQRVLIALAFASRPALLVADEPTTALDVVSQAHIVRLLADEQRANRTAVILITHDLRLAAHVCDDVAVLYAGDLVESGPAPVVLREPLHPYTRMLRDAVPPLEGPRRPLPAVAEFMPGLGMLAGLTGCRFAPRCPNRSAGCGEALPVLRTAAPGHQVRCVAACSMAATAGFPVEGRDPAGAANALARQPGAAAAPAAAMAPAAAAGPAVPGSLAAAAAADGTPVLQFDAVSLTYSARRGLLGRRTRVDAVRNVSFAVRPGEIVGLVGESGSGKSSIARLALGLERPSGGRIAVSGRLLAAGEHDERVQIVFQDPQSALNPRRSVLRLVTQALEAPGHAAPVPARLRRADELLRDTGLPRDLAGRFPAQLSGGQRQRVNIARALCVTPHILVADEIVSGLDVSVQSQILNLLLQRAGSLGLALLFITHDLGVVRYLCSRVLVMYRGELVESGTVEQVFTDPKHPYTRMLLAAVPPEDPERPWPPEAAALELPAALAASERVGA